uniref:Uncharacterized protein n=1 Tax=Rhizophora mucronata TaxID=61149 RepID=A0A2P2PS07_RHIMU
MLLLVKHLCHAIRFSFSKHRCYLSFNTKANRILIKTRQPRESLS